MQLHEAEISDWRFWPVGSDREVCADSVSAEIELASESSPIAYIAPNKESDPEFLSRLDTESVTRVERTDERCPMESGAEVLLNRKRATAGLAVGGLAAVDQAQQLLSAARQVLTVSMVFMLVASAACWWKYFCHASRLEEAKLAEVDLFHEAFPGASVPLAVASRFESKHREILGARGAGDAANFPQSVLTGLKPILSAHRSPVRSQFQEISVRDDTIEIECVFRSHDDASAMVRSLTEAGLVVDPPQLQKLDDKRVGTRIRARLVGTGSGELEG